MKLQTLKFYKNKTKNLTVKKPEWSEKVKAFLKGLVSPLIEGIDKCIGEAFNKSLEEKKTSSDSLELSELTEKTIRATAVKTIKYLISYVKSLQLDTSKTSTYWAQHITNKKDFEEYKDDTIASLKKVSGMCGGTYLKDETDPFHLDRCKDDLYVTVNHIQSNFAEVGGVKGTKKDMEKATVLSIKVMKDASALSTLTPKSIEVTDFWSEIQHKISSWWVNIKKFFSKLYDGFKAFIKCKIDEFFEEETIEIAIDQGKETFDTFISIAENVSSIAASFLPFINAASFIYRLFNSVQNFYDVAQTFYNAYKLKDDDLKKYEGYGTGVYKMIKLIVYLSTGYKGTPFKKLRLNSRNRKLLKLK